MRESEGHNSQDPRAIETSMIHRKCERRARGPQEVCSLSPVWDSKTLNTFYFCVSTTGKGPAPFSSCQKRLTKITEAQLQEDKHLPAHVGQRPTLVLAVTGGRHAWL